MLSEKGMAPPGPVNMPWIDSEPLLVNVGASNTMGISQSEYYAHSTTNFAIHQVVIWLAVVRATVRGCLISRKTLCQPLRQLALNSPEA